MADKYVHLSCEEDQKDQLEEYEETDVLLAAKTEYHPTTIDRYQGDYKDRNEPNVPHQVQVSI